MSCAFAQDHGLKAAQILYTPVEATFSFIREEISESAPDRIVFHGTADPWVETPVVEAACRRRSLPLYITEGGNHSLETGNVLKDLQTISRVMEQVRVWLDEVQQKRMR